MLHISSYKKKNSVSGEIRTNSDSTSQSFRFFPHNSLENRPSPPPPLGTKIIFIVLF